MMRIQQQSSSKKTNSCNRQNSEETLSIPRTTHTRTRARKPTASNKGRAEEERKCDKVWKDNKIFTDSPANSGKASHHIHETVYCGRFPSSTECLETHF